MVGSINPYAILPLTAVVAFFMLAAYLLIKVPFNETRNMALAVILTLMSWALGESIMKLTTDANIALISSKILVCIGGSYIGAVGLHFDLVLTGYLKREKDTSLYLGLYFIPIYFSVIRAATDSIIAGVTLKYWGYSEYSNGGLFWPYALSILVYLSIGLFVLYETQRKSEGKTKKAYQILFIGTLIPMVFGGFSYMVTPLFGIEFPDVTMTSTVVLAIAMIVAMQDLKAFDIVPVKEKGKYGKDGKPKRSPFVLPSGKIYYINEHKPDASLKAFASLVYSGRQGLALVRMNPRKFREMTGLETTPVIWLSSQEAPGERTINPSAIPRLFTTINEFLASAKDPVILIEGIETMIFINNFREVMGFLSQMYERISAGEDLMIIPISKATVNESEWALMTKHMDDLTPFLPDLTTDRRPEIKG